MKTHFKKSFFNQEKVKDLNKGHFLQINMLDPDQDQVLSLFRGRFQEETMKINKISLRVKEKD